MATERWIAGTGEGLTWGSAFNSADINIASFANNGAVMSSVLVANGTALDTFADISVNLAAITTVAPAMLAFFLYPANQDAGPTYGDNQFTAGGYSATKVPGAPYWVGNIVFPVLTTTATYGMLRGIIMPPGSFYFVVQNQSGATLATTGNTIAYRTYNLQVT